MAATCGWPGISRSTPASVRARVVEREELAVDIEQSDPLITDVDQSRLTGARFRLSSLPSQRQPWIFPPSTRFPRVLERGGGLVRLGGTLDRFLLGERGVLPST
jgi:hypothetical protein